MKTQKQQRVEQGLFAAERAVFCRRRQPLERRMERMKGAWRPLAPKNTILASASGPVKPFPRCYALDNALALKALISCPCPLGRCWDL